MKSVALLSLAILFTPIVAHAGEVLSVKSASANFRAAPNDKAKIVYAADQFYPVEVVKRQNGWAQVKDFEGDLAWVSEKVLTKQATIVIKNDKANIREEPNPKSDALFQVERGEVFKIEKRHGASLKGAPGMWLKVVDANGDGGWIRADMAWGDIEAGADLEKAESDDKLKTGDKPKEEKAKTGDDKPEDKEDGRACEMAKSGEGETVKLEKCSCSCKSVEVHGEKNEKKVDLTDVAKPKDADAKPASANDKAKMGTKADKPKAAKPKNDKKAPAPKKAH
jgi:SH3-like domain-containing protein